MTKTTSDTQIIADPNLPTVEIVRDFDAPVENVFRAWTEPDLVVQWLGPTSTTMRLDHWDCRTGGSYRYAALVDGEEVARFYGSFHEIRPNRLVQTFAWEGAPDGVSLDTLTLEELPGGRTRTRILSVVDSMEAQRAMMASGMETGINEGYAKLDALLPTL